MNKPEREYIATFQVKFNPDDMVDEYTLHKDFNGSWDKYMKWLFDQEGIGIFNNDLEFIRVIK